MLGIIGLLAGPLGGAEMGAKPSPERTPPPTYERSNLNQYEKPLDLLRSPQTEEASPRHGGQKKRNPASTAESSWSDKSSTTKAKKKVKKLPDEEATSSGIDLDFKKAVPPPSPFSSKETEGRR